MLSRGWIIGLIGILLIIVAALLLQWRGPQVSPVAVPTHTAAIGEVPSASDTPTLTVTPSPSASHTPTLTSTPVPPPVGQSGEWELIFADEFAGPNLDRERWTVCYWWDRDGCTNQGNNELEWYTPDNILMQDGMLRLQAQIQTVRASDGNSYEYTSGMVTTGPSTHEDTTSGFAFRTGYAEIRARAPSGAGLWPAFWLLPTDFNSTPEIDVLEILGHETDVVHMHFHYLDERGNDPAPGEKWKGPDFSADWHVYAVDWRADQIIWYVDGVERWRFTDQQYVPNTDMYLLINLAVGGDWPGSPTSETVFPSYYDIDYVRVWQTLD